MRRVSGKISLATRRIWGDPEDEDELSAITSSGLRHNESKFTTSTEEGGHSGSAYNDDVKVRAKVLYSGQALEKDGELPIDSKKSNPSLDEKHAIFPPDSDNPEETFYNPLTKATLPEQTDRNFKENGDSSFHDSISSSVVRPLLSYHDALRKDSAPCNDTKLTRDHSEAPQDLHKSVNLSHKCSKMNVEDQKVSEVMTKAENRFFASENSNSQENITSTNGPYFGKHINDLVFENAVEDSSIVPMAIESKEIKSRNSNPSSNEGKLQLNFDVSELDNDNVPEIVSSKLDKLKSCDEKISTNLENENSQVSVLLEIENQLICKSSSEFHPQLCSKEIDDGNETIHVVEPSTFNENCVNRDYMSSSVTDLSDSLALENKQSIDEAHDKKTRTNFDLSDEIICLDQALPLHSHSQPKNNASDSVSLDEDKLSRCTGITEYTNEESAKPIISESVLNIAKDESNENNIVGLNVQESQLRSQMIDISNEEVDEGYTLITAYNNLYNQVGVNNANLEDNHDFSRKSSNKYSDSTNTLLTNVKDSKENDKILSLSDDNGKHYCFQSSGFNLPDIVNQHTARMESITHEDKSSEYDNKPNDIRNKDFEDTENLLEANCTSNGETISKINPEISNSAEVNKLSLLDTDNSNISVKDIPSDTEKNEADLKDSDEAENRAEVETENMNDEKIEKIIESIEDLSTDTTANNTMGTTADRIEGRTENKTEEKIEEITERNKYIATDTTASSVEERIEEKSEEILDKIENTIVDTTLERIEDRIEETAGKILDKIGNIIADITADNNVDTTAERNEDRTEEEIEEIKGRINDTITDTTAYRIEDCNVNQIEEKIEEKIEKKIDEKNLEIISSIEDRTEGNTKDIVESRVIKKVTTQKKNQAGDDIVANFFMSEASKLENIGDKIDYNTNEINGHINAHRTDLNIESVVPIDQKFGKDNTKLQLEGAELSETETVKTNRNRKTWLRYVKSFEKRHEESDSSSIKLSSARESSGQSERIYRNETIAFTPKIPETPMKKKYTPSHSGSITPDKRRRSFRKKIKEKISDTLHKLKD